MSKVTEISNVIGGLEGVSVGGILSRLKPTMAVKLLDKEFFEEYGIPSYATNGSAGLDLLAHVPEDIVVEPGEVKLVPTGMCIQLPSEDLVAFLLPKSGIGHKSGIILGNGTGVIDADYREQMFVSVWNRSAQAFTISRGMKICQMVILPVVQVNLEIKDELTETDRSGGFGSTGKFINR
jgi:dUTP pyrophosphatase